MKEEQSILSKLAFGSTKTDGRAHLYDNVKFFLIILVVTGHLIGELIDLPTPHGAVDKKPLFDGMFVFIYSFHMPAFLFLSGLFAKKHTDKLNWQPVKVYVVLGLLLKILVGFSQMMFCPDKNSGYFSLLGGDGVYWYLFVLAAYYVITYIVRDFDSRFFLVFAILLSLMAGYDGKTDEWLSLSRIVVFLPFYYAGYCLTPDKVERFCKRWYIVIPSTAAICFWWYVFIMRTEEIRYLRRLFTGKNPYKVVQLPNTEFWHRGLAMLISAVMIIAVISLVPSRVMPFFTKYGSRTLQVYFWHRSVVYYIVFSEFFEDILQRKLPNHWWWAALLICIVISYLLSYEMFGRPVRMFMKMMGKPQKNNV